MTAEALTFPDAATRARLRNSDAALPSTDGALASYAVSEPPSAVPPSSGRMEPCCSGTAETELSLLASDPVIRLSEATGGQGECHEAETERAAGPRCEALPQAERRLAAAPTGAKPSDAEASRPAFEGALSSIAAKRAEQHVLGYTPEHDLQGPIGLLANVANRYLQDARDWLHRPGRDPGRKHYRLKLVNAAALIAAEIDRLDHELETADHG